MFKQELSKLRRLAIPKISKYSIVSGLFACILIGCSAADAPQSSVDDVVKIQLTDVPTNITDVVMSMSPGFKMVEVLKKRREGRVYYDVEGELPNGEEIEFDVLMTAHGPKVVEIQRDILWAAVPQSARDVVAKANSDNLDIVRVIESKQADADIIIYEIFVAKKPARPRFEVSVSSGAPAKLLDTPWEH